MEASGGLNLRSRGGYRRDPRGRATLVAIVTETNPSDPPTGRALRAWSPPHVPDWKYDGDHTVTAYLTVDDAEGAIEFYLNAFGATEHMRLQLCDRIGHAGIVIGDTPAMLSDEFPDIGKLGPKARGGAISSLMIYVPDVDAAFDKAVAAGAEVVRPGDDQFYGDRSGWLKDPFWRAWTISTHVEDVSEGEMHQRMQAMMEAGDG